MTTTSQPRTRSYRDQYGNTATVSGGAQRQDGPLTRMICNGCGHDVVWATSSRTGGKYLVDVLHGVVADYYSKRALHRCDAHRGA